MDSLVAARCCVLEPREQKQTPDATEAFMESPASLPLISLLPVQPLLQTYPTVVNTPSSLPWASAHAVPSARDTESSPSWHIHAHTTHMHSHNASIIWSTPALPSGFSLNITACRKAPLCPKASLIKDLPCASCTHSPVG